MRTHLYVTEFPTSRLYTVDPATGSAGLVGPINVPQVTDIAFHGPTLYAITFGRLLRLDPDTGAVLWTGTGTTGGNTNGLAVAEDGTIYAGNGGQLMTINPTNGQGTVVGSFGGGLGSSGDLVFDANGTLYGALQDSSFVDVLARIAPSGAATVIGPIGIPNVWGLAIHCCRFFGCTTKGELLSINAATGQGTVIGKQLPPFQMGGMSARPCCC